jgi:hypothetical protein
MERKDHTGRNTAEKLEYYNGFFLLNYHKNYLDMNIHERIIIRTSYTGNTAPSLMIKQLIQFNNDPNYIAF